MRDHSLAEIWHRSPAFEAFRGTDWMREPCRSCAHREEDFGGCRCQALALAGDAAATDPVCEFSPLHDAVRALADAESGGDDRLRLSRPPGETAAGARVGYCHSISVKASVALRGL